MRQIYVNTIEKIFLNVFKGGELYNASATPTFSISVVGSGDTPRTGTAVLVSTGVYYFLVEPIETSIQQVLKIDWTFEVDSIPMTRVDYISVVMPYATFSAIKEISPTGTSDSEIENAEMFSRYMISAVSGVDFALQRKTINLFGNGKKTLVLPYRLETLLSISVNDQEVWTPGDNLMGRNISITDTNYGLLSEKADTVPSENSLDYPSWSKVDKYTIYGEFGWVNIPDEIEYCAKLLADDYFCKETSWKKRFVEQINASDWRVVFNSKQFQGTGNFFVDQILNEYKSIGMVLI